MSYEKSRRRYVQLSLVVPGQSDPCYYSYDNALEIK